MISDVEFGITLSHSFGQSLNIQSVRRSYSLLNRVRSVREHETIILPLVLYECEMWSFTTRKVFQNVCNWEVWSKRVLYII